MKLSPVFISPSSSAFGLHHLPRELYGSLAATSSSVFNSQSVTLSEDDLLAGAANVKLVF